MLTEEIAETEAGGGRRQGGRGLGSGLRQLEQALKLAEEAVTAKQLEINTVTDGIKAIQEEAAQVERNNQVRRNEINLLRQEVQVRRARIALITRETPDFAVRRPTPVARENIIITDSSGRPIPTLSRLHGPGPRAFQRDRGRPPRFTFEDTATGRRPTEAFDRSPSVFEIEAERARRAAPGAVLPRGAPTIPPVLLQRPTPTDIFGQGRDEASLFNPNYANEVNKQLQSLLSTWTELREQAAEFQRERGFSAIFNRDTLRNAYELRNALSLGPTSLLARVQSLRDEAVSGLGDTAPYLQPQRYKEFNRIDFTA